MKKPSRAKMTEAGLYKNPEELVDVEPIAKHDRKIIGMTWGDVFIHHVADSLKPLKKIEPIDVLTGESAYKHFDMLPAFAQQFMAMLHNGPGMITKEGFF